MKGPCEGFLPVDKPAGLSSFSVVAAVRRRFHGVKTGHAGTLDPAASGLLVLALGRATRLLPFVPLEPKVYRFGVRFGVQTDTLDADGVIIKSGGNVPERAALEAVLPRFVGETAQVPPDYSALKVGGVRAYKLARQGRRPGLAPRRITIFSLKLTGGDEAAGTAEFEVSCSAGMYVRSLARDLAGALGTCGHASFVRRTAAGGFDVDRALAFAELDAAEENVLPIAAVVGGLPKITVDEDMTRALRQGRDIVVASAPDGETVFAFNGGDDLVAVLKGGGDKGRFHPVRVFA